MHERHNGEHYLKGTTLKSLRDNSHHNKKLTVYLNGTEDENLVQPLDPFLSNLVGGTKFDTLQIDYKIEDIQFEQRTFDVDCNHFIIPHKELVPDEWKSRLDRIVELNNGQGIYFYRNNRLITFGGWGGVIGIETHRVHSRVKLQIPSYPEAAEYFEYGIPEWSCVGWGILCRALVHTSTLGLSDMCVRALLYRLLYILLVLQAYWMYLILKVAVTLVTGGTAEDIRSDSDDDGEKMD